MGYEITSGKIQKAQKVVIYGPEGIGKSTFLSNFPGVVFIDTEGSTKELDVKRLPPPTSWTMLLDEIKAVRDGKVGAVGTLAIDTADWAEKMCFVHICTSRNVSGIEDFGYGKGYTYAAEEWGKMLNLLTEVINRGVNIAIGAHAMMRKFEQPDELGAYDRWELKLDKRTGSMLKEWADMLLFANYQTIVVSSSNKMEKNKVQGGKRVVYTSHNPCWDAKNRVGLSEKINLDFAEIAPHIPSTLENIVETAKAADVPVEVVKKEPEVVIVDSKDEVPKDWTDSGQIIDIPFGMPEALTDLMMADVISQKEVEHAVALRGYYPENTSMTKYDPDFISGVLVAAWPQIKDMIYDLRKTEGDKHEY